MRSANTTTINSLHKNIKRIVREVASVALEVASGSASRNWERVPAGASVDFELAVDELDTRGVLCDYIDRDIGGRSFAFSLIPQPSEEPTLWAGWYEQWLSMGNGSFDLVGLSWTFYWGVYRRPRPVILRGEWDNLNYRSQRAAQPHWHIEPSLLIDSYRPISTSVSIALPEGDLVELAPVAQESLAEETKPSGIQELSLKGMHLGMGGWHHSKEHPACWRCQMPSGWNDIVSWARRVLVYAREQFVDEFRAAVPLEIT